MLKKFALIFLLFPILALSAAAGQEIQIKLFRPENAPYFIGMPEQNIYADEFTTIVLDISASSDTTARLFWLYPYDQQVSEFKSIQFFVKGSPFHNEYVFNIGSQNRSWTGFIKQVVVMPDKNDARININFAKAETTGLISLMLSGWAELWGPGTRFIIGPSVNNMRATTLFGRPISFYCYWVVFLSFIISFAFFFYGSKDISKAYDRSGKAAAAAVAACLVFMVLSQLVSEKYQLSADVSRYGGKTLAEKEAEMNGPALDGFFREVKASVPQRARVEMMAGGPNRTFNEQRAGFVLYPMELYSTQEVRYVLVFEPDQDTLKRLEEKKGFVMFKKFNERAYILWKKK